jgi:hypothetical protein
MHLWMTSRDVACFANVPRLGEWLKKRSENAFVDVEAESSGAKHTESLVAPAG